MTRPLKGKNLKNEIIDSLMTSSDDSGIQGLKATTNDKKPSFQLNKNTTPVLNNLSTSETYNQKDYKQQHEKEQKEIKQKI